MFSPISPPHLIFKLSRQLDGTRRSVFKENVRLSEALKYHIKEAQQLQKLTTSLEKEKTSLALDKVCRKDGTANRGVTGSHWIDIIHLHQKKKESLFFSLPSCYTC